MSNIIGRCSICGGDVTVYTGAWMGTVPPVPTCQTCGATPKNTMPVIPMNTPIKYNIGPNK